MAECQSACYSSLKTHGKTRRGVHTHKCTYVQLSDLENSKQSILVDHVVWGRGITSVLHTQCYEKASTLCPQRVLPHVRDPLSPLLHGLHSHQPAGRQSLEHMIQRTGT